MSFQPLLRLNSILLAVLVSTSCQLTDPTSAPASDHHHGDPDQPAVHGMLVFGTERIWMSHLPMFHQPHDYQVIMEVKLKKGEQDLKPLYLDDQAQSGAPYYTFVPKRFSLTHLITGHMTLLEGTLVRGHFERGGTAIASGVTAEIVSLPVAQKFLPDAVKPLTASYYVLGDTAEMFLVHQIVAKPLEYDQIIRVSTEGHATGILTTGLVNEPDQRLLPGMDLTARTGSGLPVTISAGEEVYFETGDLEL